MSGPIPFKIEEFERNKNYCIEASAGTGKTYSIRKIVAKLIESGIPLSKILLVTYTEKAAGELRDRIRAEIEERVSQNGSADERSRAEKALAEIDSATIGTIHSFCQKTLRDFAYESNMPFALSMAEDDMVEKIVDRKIRDEWAEELGNRPVEEFRTMLVNAVKAYRDGISFAEPMTFENWISENPEFESNWEILQKYSGEKYLALNGKSGKEYPVSQLMDCIREKRSSKFTNCGTSLVSASSEELNKALEYFFVNRKEEIIETDSAENAEKWKFVYKKVKEVYEAFQARKLENRQISFDDMIDKVRQAVVSENSPLCQKIRETYTYAIIDEFQDTNREQWDVFKTVFLNSLKNHIIVVGDPKQSIYSFQGADLDVYFEARGEIGDNGGVCCVLDTNYRSTNGMVNFCGELFEGDFFKSESKISFDASKSSGKMQSAKRKGEDLKPVFLAEDADEESFAKYAVSKILEFTKPNGDETALRCFDKDKGDYRNLKLSDVAVLARSRSEMETIEREMALAGIPFVRYKDANLFKGREGKQWIVLLKALAAPDFSGRNRGLLNAALVTDFFRFSPQDVESGDFENPRNAVIRHFADWRSLFKKFRYAELQERIFADTQIDSFLCESSKLQQSAKVRQIGAYIFDYLYNNNRVSLEEVVKHLEGLSLSTEDADDEDGNLVSKGSDFEAVQVMTIHASKGLQFPVVISVAGFKTLPNGNNTSIFATSRENKNDGAESAKAKKFIGFDRRSKKLYREKTLDEWRRLFYVDFTRAESVLILPYYREKWEQGKNKEPFGFLQKALSSERINAFVYRESVKNVAASGYERPKLESPEDVFEAPIQKLNGEIFSKSIFQHSYSSLSRREKSEENENDVSDNGENSNQDGDSGYVDSAAKALSVDPNPVRIFAPSEEKISENVWNGVRNYPRGSRLGNALHQTFELLDFQRVGGLENVEAVLRDDDLKKCIREQFRSQAFDIEEHPDWEKQSASYVWNTMNARLPEICGGKGTGKFFSLRKIPSENRRAEMEFQMNVFGFGENVLQNYCKGFVDLLFERDGRYSILDWKSDVLENYGVGSGEDSDGTTAKVDGEYAVQRVLYSYCLIQWLKSFGTFGKTEEEIFKNHFGGVYYVFFRGCRAGESFGLYAQTWENYAELEKAFEKVKELPLKKRKMAKNSSEEQDGN